MSNDEPLFDSDVDPKRIKSVADGLRRQGEFESARMLDSYAAMLAAAPQQAAEPVYQYQTTPDSWVDCDYDLYNASGDPKRILYTHPQPAQDAKLPSDEDFRLHLGELTPAELRVAQAAARYVLAGTAQDAKDAALLEWAARRWRAEVMDRPLVNVHRRPLDDAWRQVIRHAGGDDVVICGPRHDDLVAMAKESGR